MKNKELYYKTWAIMQKEDICFFTYKEETQNIMILFFLIALAYKTGKILYDKLYPTT